MTKKDYPVVILAGGFGTRLREETEFRPKPMVPIGGRPIIWHIMKSYAHYGFYKFIICLGYKGDMIKDYFLNYGIHGVDVTINTKTGVVIEHQENEEGWEVTLTDTGENCFTGGRVARASRYIDTDKFLLTYGDGVADVNLDALLKFHNSHGKIATVTGVTVPSRFGNLEIDADRVISFSEKNVLSDKYINGGFFVFEKEFLKYLVMDSSCVLERAPLHDAARDGQLMVYRHNGFWQCMDTFRERQKLEELWKNGAPWKLWEDTNRELEPASLFGDLPVDNKGSKTRETSI